MVVGGCEQVARSFVGRRKNHFGLGGDAMVGVFLHTFDLESPGLDRSPAEALAVVERSGAQSLDLFRSSSVQPLSRFECSRADGVRLAADAFGVDARLGHHPSALGCCRSHDLLGAYRGSSEEGLDRLLRLDPSGLALGCCVRTDAVDLSLGPAGGIGDDPVGLDSRRCGRTLHDEATFFLGLVEPLLDFGRSIGEETSSRLL